MITDANAWRYLTYATKESTYSCAKLKLAMGGTELLVARCVTCKAPALGGEFNEKTLDKYIEMHRGHDFWVLAPATGYSE